MTDRDRKRNIYTFEEDDPSIMERLDERAKQEGTSRSALIRRGIRMVLISLPIVPEIVNSTEAPRQEAA